MPTQFGTHAPYHERAARGLFVSCNGVQDSPAVISFAAEPFMHPRSSLGLRLRGAGGGALLPGFKGYQTVPCDCVVKGWTLLADRAGSVVFDIFRSRIASFPPDDGDLLCPLTAFKPQLVDAQRNFSWTVHNWQTALRQDDILGFEILSVSGGINALTLTLVIARNNQP